MTININQYLVHKDISVRVAMKQLDSTHRKILFLVDENNVLKGSISDGDIRRWILSDGSLNDSVVLISNVNTFYVNEDYSIEKIREIIFDKKYTAVPVCDQNNKIIDILFWDQIFEGNKSIQHFDKIDAHVIVMAGGQGTRLEPFTKILPKPLIPIGDKTIIELIIDKFLNFQIDNFFISVNHKAKIIKSYFEELSPNYSIEYIDENKPLGTIGALYLLKGRFTKPIIITNCDIIIDTNYSDFLKFHQENNFDISLIASLMNHKVPYGVCEIENGGVLIDFKEKPEFSFLASTGMYIINPDLINLIPEDTFFHITDLMNLVRKNGGKVGVFPIGEDAWLDTGEWHEYRKTVDKLRI